MLLYTLVYTTCYVEGHTIADSEKDNIMTISRTNNANRIRKLYRTDWWLFSINCYINIGDR